MLSELYESDLDLFEKYKAKLFAKWSGKEVPEETAGDDDAAAGGDDDAADDDEWTIQLVDPSTTLSFEKTYIKKSIYLNT